MPRPVTASPNKNRVIGREEENIATFFSSGRTVSGARFFGINIDAKNVPIRLPAWLVKLRLSTGFNLHSRGSFTAKAGFD